jgi:hypothetical protein
MAGRLRGGFFVLGRSPSPRSHMHPTGESMARRECERVLFPRGARAVCCAVVADMRLRLRGAICVRALHFFLAASGKGQGAPKGAVLLRRHVCCQTCRRLRTRLKAASMQCRAALSSLSLALKQARGPVAQRSSRSTRPKAGSATQTFSQLLAGTPSRVLKKGLAASLFAE